MCVWCSSGYHDNSCGDHAQALTQLSVAVQHDHCTACPADQVIQHSFAEMHLLAGSLACSARHVEQPPDLLKLCMQWVHAVDPIFVV